MKTPIDTCFASKGGCPKWRFRNKLLSLFTSKKKH